MRKLIVLFAIAFALAASPTVFAKKDKGADKGGQTKYWICHVTSLISDGDLYTGISGSQIPPGETVGQLLRVAEPSLPAHCAHGDRVFDFEGAPFEPVYGLCRPDRGPGLYDLDCADLE